MLYEEDLRSAVEEARLEYMLIHGNENVAETQKLNIPTNKENFPTNSTKTQKGRRRRRQETDGVASAEGEGNESAGNFENGNNFNAEEIYQNFLLEAKKSRKSPEEPIIIAMLGSSGNITPMEKCPKEEKDRRKDIEKHRIVLEIFFNDLEALKTAPRPLNSDFCVTFGNIYNLHIMEWPQSIKIKVVN